MPRLITSSVSSRVVQCVIGPSGLLGRFAGDGEDLDDLLRGKLAGGAWAWFVGEDRFDGPSQDGAGLAALDVNESVPRVGPAPSPASDLAMCQADPLGDVLIEKAVEGQHNDRGALPSREGAVTEREKV